MIFFERKGFRGGKKFIFHRGKAPQKFCDVLKNDAVARHVAPDTAIFSPALRQRRESGQPSRAWQPIAQARQGHGQAHDHHALRQEGRF